MNTLILLAFVIFAVIDSPSLGSNCIFKNNFFHENLLVSGVTNCSYVTFSDNDVTIKSQTMYNFSVTARQVLKFNATCVILFF